MKILVSFFILNFSLCAWAQHSPDLYFDYEYDVPGTHHHLSVGLASDVHFKIDHNNYFVGSLLSTHYHHFTAKWTHGVSTPDFQESHDEDRVIVGYEIEY